MPYRDVVTCWHRKCARVAGSVSISTQLDALTICRRPADHMQAGSAIDRAVFRRGPPPRSQGDAVCHASPPPPSEQSAITRRQLADGAAKLALSVALTTAARPSAPTAAAELTLEAVTPPIAPAQPLSSRCWLLWGSHWATFLWCSTVAVAVKSLSTS